MVYFHQLDSHGILFVKIDDDNEAKEYGLENLPVLIYFENKVTKCKYFKLNCQTEICY